MKTTRQVIEDLGYGDQLGDDPDEMDDEEQPEGAADEVPSLEQVNSGTALWARATSELSDEEYDEFYKHLTLDFEKPLLHAHLVSDAPVDLRSILYIPSRLERGALSPRTDFGLKLYVRNVLIQEYNKDLLPNYLRFVEGVVESEDLPLNISRQSLQDNALVAKLRRVIREKRYAVVIVRDAYQDGSYRFVASDLAGRARDTGFTPKGDLIWYQAGTRLRPYGYPHAFVPNIVHQHILVLRAE